MLICSVPDGKNYQNTISRIRSDHMYIRYNSFPHVGSKMYACDEGRNKIWFSRVSLRELPDTNQISDEPVQSLQQNTINGPFIHKSQSSMLLGDLYMDNTTFEAITMRTQVLCVYIMHTGSSWNTSYNTNLWCVIELKKTSIVCFLNTWMQVCIHITVYALTKELFGDYLPSCEAMGDIHDKINELIHSYFLHNS